MTRWALLLLLLAGAGCAVAYPPLPVPAAGGGVTAPAPVLEREIHALINERRTARGLSPLGWDERVAAAAREHSAAMAAGRRSFGHAGFQERIAALRESLPVAGAAENVAYDSRTGPGLAGQVVQGWIRSTGHRENLEGAFHRTGVGVARSRDGVHYFTQLFVAVRR